MQEGPGRKARPFTFTRGTTPAPPNWGYTPITPPPAPGSLALDPGGAMRIMKFIFTLAAAMALAGCIFHSTRAGHGSSHPGKGPPPGHGWRK